MAGGRAPSPRRRSPAWRRPLGWSAVVLGTVLVLYGYWGAAAGVRLAFDPHHTLSQLVGLVLVITGLAWVTSRS